MSVKNKIEKEISNARQQLQYDVDVSSTGTRTELRIYDDNIRASLLNKLLDIEEAYEVNNFGGNNNIRITYKE